MKIEALDFAYGEFDVFRAFQLEIPIGLSLIAGPSGCGKTTLLKLITGFLPTNNGSLPLSSENCLLVIQEDSLIPWLTGTQNLSLFLPRHMLQSELESHPGFLLCAKFIHKKAWQMSYGQRRILEIFRAVLSKANILCLDEPLNYIDFSTRRAIVQLLTSDANQSSYTIIATHDWIEFENAVDNIFVFDGEFPVSSLQSTELQPLLLNRKLQ